MMSKDMNNNWRVRNILYILVMYFILLLIFFYFQNKVFGEEVIDGKKINIYILIIEEIIDALFLSILPIIYVVKLYGADIKEIGLTLNKYGKNIIIGIIGGIVLWIICSLVNEVVKIFAGSIPVHPYIQKLNISKSSSIKYIILFSLVLLTPIAEEIFFRGFVFTVFKKRYGRFIGIIASSILFMIFHFQILWFAQILIVGICLAILFEYSCSLVSVVIAHSIINLLSIYIGKM